MVVGIINVDGMPVREAKRYPPIPRHRNGIMSLENSLQCVEPKPRQVHALRRPAPVQDRKDVAQFLDMFRRQAPGRSSIVQSLQAAMFERSDHLSDL